MIYKPSPDLVAKHEKYLNLLPQVQDTNGFIEVEKCDSLLFSGLLGCVPGVPITLRAAEDTFEPGKWYRRPSATSIESVTTYPECFATNGATSQISRDMLVGVIWWAWVNRRVGVVENICDYALGHFGVMGRGKLSQTLMSPSLLNTFAWISYKLGGKSYPLLRLLPCYISAELTDYQRHLAVLHGLLRHKMGLRVNPDIFFKATNRQPANPLFNYAAGFPAAAEAQLLNEQLWPADRLPTNGDRSESWVLQRDWGDDWMSDQGPPTKTFSGGDFLFVSALLQGLI